MIIGTRGFESEICRYQLFKRYCLALNGPTGDGLCRAITLSNARQSTEDFIMKSSTMESSTAMYLIFFRLIKISYETNLD